MSSYLLIKGGNNYEDLFIATERLIEEFGECIPINIHIATGSNVQVDDVSRLLKDAFHSLQTRVAADKKQSFSPYANISIPIIANLSESRFDNFGEGSVFLADLTKLTPEKGFKVFIVGESLALTTAVFLDENLVTTFIIGENLVLENRTSTIERLLASSLGLPPLWGVNDDCDDDDGIADTPIHSAPNYDCDFGHVNGCTYESESLNNLMDARYCDFERVLSEGQIRFLKDRFARLPQQKCIDQLDTDSGRDCITYLKSNRLQPVEGNLEFGSSFEGENGSTRAVSASIEYSVYSNSRLVMSGAVDNSIQTQESVSLNLSTLRPGFYTLTFISGKQACTEKIIIQ